jgi:hypothetical protein
MTKLLDYCYRCEAPIVTTLSIPREQRLCVKCAPKPCRWWCASQRGYALTSNIKPGPCDCGAAPAPARRAWFCENAGCGTGAALDKTGECPRCGWCGWAK